jgi:CHASE2 domain-containing sensor protein
VIAFVLTIKLIVERTTFGKEIELLGYNFLQLQLSPRRLPVDIVDISDLEPLDFIDGQIVRATPRDKLKGIIEAIADQQPRAIGVDIDLSPDDFGYVHPHDKEFFQFCKEIRKLRGVPLFLGINRTMIRPPNEWLGSATNRDMAASISAPQDSSRMIRFLKIEDESMDDGIRRFWTCKSMSAALAEAYGPQGFFIDKLVSCDFLERFSQKPLGSGLTAEEFLVDFSPIESIEPLRTIEPIVLRDRSQRKRFQGKVVLIGDAAQDKATDNFLVPGRPQPYAGVFLHACATYTLIKAPLYLMTWKGRVGVDLLLSMSICLTILLIRLYYNNRRPEEVAVARLEVSFTFLVVFVAMIGGVMFVRITRVVWDDFMLVLPALAFHPTIKRYLEWIWGQARQYAPVAFHKFLFKPNNEDHR